MRRRDFLRTVLGGSVLAAGEAWRHAADRLAAAEPADAKPPAPGGKPNLLLILVDDLGYGDLSSYGAKDLRTPHIDRLIADGMRFDNFYANCPVCSPTRASILTGRYPDLVGVPGVIRTHADNSWGYLSPKAVLLPRVLKPAGYTSAIVGKWHLGLTSPNTPNERGFGFFHGFLGDMMDDYLNHRRHGQNYMRKDGEVLQTSGTHATDLFTTWACEYIRSRRGTEAPFFLYLAYNAPHSPIQPPKDWLDRVRQREPDLPLKRAKLVALIEHLDDRVGQVLKALDDAGLAKSTLVIFTSDNGGDLACSAHNGPTRAGKGTVYEGGIRVPAGVRWPGRVRPGSRSDRVALTMDIFPTLAQAAGAKIDHEIDGVGFLPTLLRESQPQPQRDLFFRRREGGGLNGKTIECIRRGPWKALRSRPGAPLELYNLQTDPLEKTNLAQAEPQKLQELAAALEAQLKRYEAVPWQPPAGRGNATIAPGPATSVAVRNPLHFGNLQHDPNNSPPRRGLRLPALLGRLGRRQAARRRACDHTGRQRRVAGSVLLGPAAPAYARRPARAP